MAQLITLTILGIVIAAAVLLGLVALVLLLLGSPTADRGLLGRSGRAIGAVSGAMLLTMTLIIARPGLLDPLCDEFDWFGAGPASTVRHYAYVAKAPIGRVHRIRTTR